MSLTQVLRLARNPGFPAGDDSQGYLINAPLDGGEKGESDDVLALGSYITIHESDGRDLTYRVAQHKPVKQRDCCCSAKSKQEA